MLALQNLLKRSASVYSVIFFKRDFGQETKTSEHLLLMQSSSRWSETAHGLTVSFEVKYDTE